MANIFGLETRTSEHDELALTKTPSLTQKKILLAERSTAVINKILNIALDDSHPSQAVMLKWAGDRMLPVSEFEKKGSGGRTSISITISGINDSVIEGEATDVEDV